MKLQRGLLGMSSATTHFMLLLTVPAFVGFRQILTVLMPRQTWNICAKICPQSWHTLTGEKK